MTTESNNWIDDFLDEVFDEFSPNLDFLFGLVQTSTLDNTHRDDIDYKIMAIDTKEEYKEVLEQLINNQTCPILSGRNYSQGDIKRHLKNL